MAKQKQSGRFLKENVSKRTASKKVATPHTPSQAPVKKHIPKTVIIFTIIALCISIAASAFFMNKLGIRITLPSKTIASGVKVAGMDVGGLTKQEAAEALQNAIGDSYTTSVMKITVLDQTLEIPSTVSGAKFNADRAAKEAFLYGFSHA